MIYQGSQTHPRGLELHGFPKHFIDQDNKQACTQHMFLLLSTKQTLNNAIIQIFQKFLIVQAFEYKNLEHETHKTQVY